MLDDDDDDGDDDDDDDLDIWPMFYHNSLHLLLG